MILKKMFEVLNESVMYAGIRNILFNGNQKYF